MVGRACSSSIGKCSRAGSTFWSKVRPTNTLDRRKSFVKKFFVPVPVSMLRLTLYPPYVPEDPPEGEAGEEHADDDAAEEEEDSRGLLTIPP